jgi:hypothetical protein
MAEECKSVIEERFGRLERENRQLRWIGMILFLGAIGAIVGSTKLNLSRPELSAQRFLLKDAKGNVRAVMGLQHDGSPQISLLDAAGKDLIVMRTTLDENAVMTFYDRGRERIALSSNSDGSAVLNFLDHTRGVASGMFLRSDGGLGLEFKGEKRGMQLDVSREGAAKLTFSDPDGSRKIGVGIDSDGIAQGLAFDSKGKPFFPPTDERRAMNGASLPAQRTFRLQPAVPAASEGCTPVTQTVGGSTCSRTFLSAP